MHDGSGGRRLTDDVGAMTWKDLLSGQDLRQVDEVAARWADPRQSADRVRELTAVALSAAAESYDVAHHPDFLVHALTTLRRHLREACRALPGPAPAP